MCYFAILNMQCDKFDIVGLMAILWLPNSRLQFPFRSISCPIPTTESATSAKQLTKRGVAYGSG